MLPAFIKAMNNHLFRRRLSDVNVVFFPKPCPIAAAPRDFILLFRKSSSSKRHLPFISFPTALAPLSPILLCDKSVMKNVDWYFMSSAENVVDGAKRSCSW